MGTVRYNIYILKSHIKTINYAVTFFARVKVINLFDAIDQVDADAQSMRIIGVDEAVSVQEVYDYFWGKDIHQSLQEGWLDFTGTVMRRE